MEWNNCTTWEDVARMTAEAIGKQMPKKAVDKDQSCTCPSCGANAPGTPYCMMCGQRLSYE